MTNLDGILKSRDIILLKKVNLVKFRLKLKKVGKTTRPFRYDLKQIPYDYTLEVTNRFKGFDLIDSLKNFGRRFVTLYTVTMSQSQSQGGSEQDHPKEKC